MHSTFCIIFTLFIIRKELAKDCSVNRYTMFLHLCGNVHLEEVNKQ